MRSHESRIEHDNNGLFSSSESKLALTTPPIIVRVLSEAQLLIITLVKVFEVLTWTGSSHFYNYLVIVLYTLICLFFESTVYFGHIILILGLLFFINIRQNRILFQSESTKYNIEEIVSNLNNLNKKIKLFFKPLEGLKNRSNMSKVLFTSLFLTPVIIFFYINLGVGPKWIVWLNGLFIFTFHNKYFCDLRSLLWKFRVIRLLGMFLTGGASKIGSSHALSIASGSPVPNRNIGDNKMFTFVIHENQRKWLGIGWSSNLLFYERNNFTDEFLNDSQSPSNYSLPPSTSFSWIDSIWKLDLTNNGSLLSSKKNTLASDPGPNDGWIYYDNYWNNPSTQDSISKYTRSRRWIRLAILSSSTSSSSISGKENINSGLATDSNAVLSDRSGNISKKKKSIRFAVEKKSSDSNE